MGISELGLDRFIVSIVNTFLHILIIRTEGRMIFRDYFGLRRKIHKEILSIIGRTGERLEVKNWFVDFVSICLVVTQMRFFILFFI